MGRGFVVEKVLFLQNCEGLEIPVHGGIFLSFPAELRPAAKQPQSLEVGNECKASSAAMGILGWISGSSDL